MPTASTSQILGNNECFEPYTSNIYVRRVLSGEFTVVNQHLLHDLTSLGLWSPEIKNQLVAANGSVQVRSLPRLAAPRSRTSSSLRTAASRYCCTGLLHFLLHGRCVLADSWSLSAACWPTEAVVACSAVWPLL